MELDLLEEDSGDERLQKWERVLQLVEILSERYKIRFSVLDDPWGCQDGLRLGMIGIYCAFPENKRGYQGLSLFTICFSRVAGLFSISSSLKNPGMLFSDSDLDEIRALLEHEGFRFIGEELLSGAYTGSWGEEYGFSTWDDRFFALAL